MKQRYNELTHELCVRAVLECFDGKWSRRDVGQAVAKYSGVSHAEICRAEANGNMNTKLEAAESIAYEMEQRICDLLTGEAEDLDLDPVTVRPRRDGMSGKVRNIAHCCVMHQLYGHLVYLGLAPMLSAKILPQQHASIPGHGQTALARQLSRYVAMKSLGIKHAKKTDVKNAYGTLRYDVVTGLLKKDVPGAKWIIAALGAIGKVAPGGTLIIGGYIDAWLFNYAMSYAMRHVLALEKVRRGQKQKLVVRAAAYMDDFGLCGRREADLKVAVRSLARWMEKELNITLKPGGTEIAFDSFVEEHRKRHEERPARRGTPSIDMGGYRVHKSFCTIRKAIFLRAQRAYLRAARQLAEIGTIRRETAQRAVSYHGYFCETNSRKVSERLHVDEIQRIAVQVCGFWEWRNERKNRLRKQEALQRCLAKKL